LASNGDLVIADGGVEKYKAYIDSIREHINNYFDTQIILVIGESAPLPMNTLRARSMTCPSYTQGNAVCDEKSNINNFAPQLASAGFDAHFIVDTGKSYDATHLAHRLTRFLHRPQRKAAHWTACLG
jgi:hypothetical protein